MKIAHIIDSVSRNAGGVFYSVNQLATELISQPGVDLSIHGLRDTNSKKDRSAWDGLNLSIHETCGPRSLGYSSDLERALVREEIDLMHVHAIWQFQSKMVHNAHKRRNLPYLISPHGMLDPWALAHSKWKKRIASILYEAAHLRDAACLHALGQSEAASIRAYGLQNPICLIPNGVTLPELLFPPSAGKGPRTLLFLGRLHPKKGLVNALRAWSEVMGHGSSVTGRDGWQFVIAGWDQGGHEAELKQLCGELGLSFGTKHEEQGTKNSEHIVFADPVFGEAKDALLRDADAFILPSFSEGLPMAVLEAWSYAIPVLMTDHCNLPEGFHASAAIRIGTDTAGIGEGLRKIFEMSARDRESMGVAGRTLVENRFTWDRVATQMKEVYAWMLGGGEKPSCVRR